MSCQATQDIMQASAVSSKLLKLTQEQTSKLPGLVQCC